MRLGLIGLGRIGAFHATTLSGLTQVESLVVYDAVPALVKSAVQRVGAEPAAAPRRFCGQGWTGS
jgi:myo-inositol 2-dehydrogenase/D-chiro-inositol 1-dehydrogenase